MRGVDRYFSNDGVLKSWPSRRSRANQVDALHRIAESFESGREYDEGEVNSVLKSRIAFEDYVLVRRELIDLGLLCRTPDCRRYWKKQKQGEEDGWDRLGGSPRYS
jgi:hypothetical protein